MNTFPSLRWLVCLLVCVVSLDSVRAGDDSPRASHPAQSGPSAAAAEMGAYLQAQKINHAIEVADSKAVSNAQGPLTVKIYDGLDAARQDAISSALSATARKTRTDGSTLEFYTLERTVGNGIVFQASALPSGNAAVSLNPGQASTVYKLKRTVRL
jgi:hypothetical protein